LSSSTERVFDRRIQQAREYVQAAERKVVNLERALAEDRKFWGEYSMIAHSEAADLRKAQAQLEAARQTLAAEEKEKERYRQGG